MMWVSRVLLAGIGVGLAASSWAAASATSDSTATAETAVISVAKHLSPPYALYLYESLKRQILSNERVMEHLDSPQSPMAKDSLWALDIISQSIVIEGQHGQYLTVRRVHPFLTHISHRYRSPSHTCPQQEVPPATRREHPGA